MRKINHIVIHCTATSIRAKVWSVVNYWKEKLGWKNPGYHYLIAYDGEIFQLQPEDKPSNGVKGHNSDSIHISYIGGVDEDGQPMDTRSAEQVEAMLKLIIDIRTRHPHAEVLGHRDFKGVNKACPSFDVKKWAEPMLNINFLNK